MKSFLQRTVKLPDLDPQVWLLAVGRLLSQIGTGFTLFYAPLFFVNEVGLSATLVGIGLGSSSISGVVGRFVGGSLADRWGRKRTLILSALIAALGSLALAFAHNFPYFVVANLIAGLGVGLYWPAAEAAVVDLSLPEQRNEAFAVTRLADSLGLGLGVVIGGFLIETTGSYPLLFILDAVSFVIFAAIVYATFQESQERQKNDARKARDSIQTSVLGGWGLAFTDQRLLVYILVNILFTTYLAQINSTLPLYFKNFAGSTGFSTATISALLTWHLVLAVLCQLPIARFLNKWTRTQALTLSVLTFGIGFLFIGAAGVSTVGNLALAIVGLGVLSVALVSYTPAASAIVADLAPPSLRGVYLSINSQCWAIGYFLGPLLGGLALDQPRPVADLFWLMMAISVGLAVVILQYLGRLLSAPDLK
jgi:MFS family permease